MTLQSLLRPALVTVLVLPLSSHADGWQPLGHAQLTAQQHESQDGIRFGADQVRAGIRYDRERLFGGLVLDFNVPDAGTRTPGTLTNVIKDVYAGWRLDPHWSVKAGQFKTPVGMDFNTPGHQLDLPQRGLEKPLVLERAPGLMLSGQPLGGLFGLDLGVFNPAGRSGATAVSSTQEGESNAYAARLRFDRQSLHVEASYGISEDAGGLGTRDYRVIDLGARWSLGLLTLKGEWVAGEQVLGIAGRREQVGYAHLGYRLAPQWEAVARHYAGRSQLPGQTDSTLGNTYLGVNFWPPAQRPVGVRLQLHYVIASGDAARYTGLGGVRGDAVLAQMQLSYP